jgi:hypothetical protein
MKKLIVLLFSIFFLSSPSVFAEDLSDFQIEGISIGDSLLDYMTEEAILAEIEINKNDYYYLNEPNKYSEIYSDKNLQTFDSIAFIVKNNPTSKYISNKNEKYIIVSIRGLIDFTNDFDGCIEKRDEIVEELSIVFPSARKTEDFFEHSANGTIIDAIYLEFDSGGHSEVSCMDYEETYRIKMNWNDNLSVSIDPEEIILWLQDY